MSDLARCHATALLCTTALLLSSCAGTSNDLRQADEGPVPSKKETVSPPAMPPLLDSLPYYTSRRDKEAAAVLAGPAKGRGYKNTPLKDVIQHLREQYGLNVYVKWAALEAADVKPSAPVAVPTKGLTVGEALEAILGSVPATHPLDYDLDEGVILITTAEDTQSRCIRRMYDVRDLLARHGAFHEAFAAGGVRSKAEDKPIEGTRTVRVTILPREPGEEPEVEEFEVEFENDPEGDSEDGPGGRFGTMAPSPLFDGLDDSPPSVEQAEEELTHLIVCVVAPDSWADSTRVGLRMLQGTLIVTQTRRNHRKIVDLLNDLRAMLRKREARRPAGGAEAGLPALLTGAPQCPEPAGDRQIDKAFRHVLKEVDFKDAKLADVFAFLRKESGLDLHVVWRALEAAGVKKDAPVTMQLTNVTTKAVLRIVLDDFPAADLGWTTEGGMATVTSRDHLAGRTSIRLYEVRDLLYQDRAFDELFPELRDTDPEERLLTAEEASNMLQETITETIAPASWSDSTLVNMHELQGVLVVVQTDENHRAISDLLTRLRDVLRKRAGRVAALRGRGGGTLPLIEAEPRHASLPDAWVSEALRANIGTLDFDRIALSDAMDFLRDACGLNLHVDWRSLETAGVKKDCPVNVHLRHVRLTKTLDVILDDAGGVNPLGWYVEDGVVRITSSETLRDRTRLRMYDLSDLLLSGRASQEPPGGVAPFEDMFAEPSCPQLVEQLTDAITRTIAPDSWADSTRIGIRELHGVLIVTQEQRNHLAIVDFLDRLRDVLRRRGEAEQAAVN